MEQYMYKVQSPEETKHEGEIFVNKQDIFNVFVKFYESVCHKSEIISVPIKFTKYHSLIFSRRMLRNCFRKAIKIFFPSFAVM